MESYKINSLLQRFYKCCHVCIEREPQYYYENSDHCVPAYNEEEGVAGVVGDLRKRIASVDVLVVNDGSCDRTAATARQWGIEVWEFQFNLGVCGAVQEGTSMRSGTPTISRFRVPATASALPKKYKNCSSYLGGECGSRGRLAFLGPRRVKDTGQSQRTAGPPCTAKRVEIF